MSSLTPWANMSSSRMFALPVEMAARRRSLCCLVSFWSLRMRTESLRELASFVVRFLRKGGAIVYPAASRVARRRAAAPDRRRRGGSPGLASPTSRVGGVCSAAAPGTPQVCGAAPCAWGGLRRKRSPRWYAAVPSGGSHAAVAVAAPRAPPESKPSGRSANLGAGWLVRSGSLDIVGDMRLCEVWPLSPSVDFGETRHQPRKASKRTSTLSAPTSVGLARTEYAVQPCDHWH